MVIKAVNHLPRIIRLLYSADKESLCYIMCAKAKQWEISASLCLSLNIDWT